MWQKEAEFVGSSKCWGTGYKWKPPCRAVQEVYFAVAREQIMDINNGLVLLIKPEAIK